MLLLCYARGVSTSDSLTLCGFLRDEYRLVYSLLFFSFVFFFFESNKYTHKECLSVCVDGCEYVC